MAGREGVERGSVVEGGEGRGGNTALLYTDDTRRVCLGTDTAYTWDQREKLESTLIVCVCVCPCLPVSPPPPPHSHP